MSKSELKIKASINQMQSNIDELVKSNKDMQKEIDKQAKMLNGFELLAENKALIRRLDDIGKRMLALTIKDAVSTEVALCYPTNAAAILRLRDESDDFWINRDRWTIDDWAKYLYDIERGECA